MLGIWHKVIFVKFLLDNMPGFPIFFLQELSSLFFTFVDLVMAILELLSDRSQLFGKLMVLNEVMGFACSRQFFSFFLGNGGGLFFQHLIARLLIKYRKTMRILNWFGIKSELEVFHSDLNFFFSSKDWWFWSSILIGSWNRFTSFFIKLV